MREILSDCKELAFALYTKLDELAHKIHDWWAWLLATIGFTEPWIEETIAEVAELPAEAFEGSSAWATIFRIFGCGLILVKIIERIQKIYQQHRYQNMMDQVVERKGLMARIKKKFPWIYPKKKDDTKPPETKS